MKRKRSRATTAASGIFARRSERRSPIVCCGPWPGERPDGWTVRSRAKARSNSSEIVPRKLEPRLLTATTSARPISSAVAVAAVRPGSERAASAASRPSTGRMRAHRPGEHAHERLDHERRDQRDPEEDRDRARHARGRDDRRGLVGGAEPEGACQPEHDQGGADARPARARLRAQALRAQDGADRRRLAGPARGRAGAQDGGDEARWRRRRPAPTTRRSACRPGSRARGRTRPARRRARSPRPSPSTAPRIPRSAASRSTEPVIFRRGVPSVRSIPISRVRWSTVMLKALKIRKPPTKRAIAAKK